METTETPQGDPVGPPGEPGEVGADAPVAEPGEAEDTNGNGEAEATEEEANGEE